VTPASPPATSHDFSLLPRVNGRNMRADTGERYSGDVRNEHHALDQSIQCTAHPLSLRPQILWQNLKHNNLGESLPGNIFTWKTFTRLFGGQMTALSLTLVPTTFDPSLVNVLTRSLQLRQTTQLIDTLAIRFNSVVVKIVLCL
jgi:hypothetical protein